MGDGHLVGFSPVSGTFKLFLQDDGTFFQEDSHRRFVQVRNDDGSFAGIAEERSGDPSPPPATSEDLGD